jgi:hypothetical protein
MAISTLLTANAITIDGTTIDQITDSQFDPRLQELVEASSGSAYPTVAAVMNGAPLMQATTRKVNTACPLITAIGKNISSAVYLYSQLYTSGGLRAGTAAHRIGLTKGIVVPRTLQCSHLGLASLSFDVFATSSDGSTAPYTLDTAAPLTTSDDELFTLGKLDMDGGVTQLLDLSIDFGLTERIESSDSDVWPSLACIESVQPRITIRTSNPAEFDDYDPAGLAISSPINLYLRKIAQGGTRTADASAAHLKCTIYEGICIPRANRFAHGEAASIELEIRPTYNGTNVPIVWTASQAIP